MITDKTISDSVKHYRALDIKSKEKLSEEVFAAQPDILLEVVALSKLNVPMEKMEVVFNLLFILYDVFQKTSEVKLPKITYDMIDKSYKKSFDMLNYLDKEGMEDGLALMYKSIGKDPYQAVLKFFVFYLKDNGLVANSKENEQCIHTSKAIMDCFIEVSTLAKR